jgi:arylsulfatase A-like enzyme
MTGKYPHANGVASNCNSNTTPFDCELQARDRCWSDVLKERGYDIGYLGKWHLEAPRRPFVESYNNSKDFAWQMTNVAGRQPDVVKRLVRQELRPWLEKTGDPWGMGDLSSHWSPLLPTQ